MQRRSFPPSYAQCDFSWESRYSRALSVATAFTKPCISCMLASISEFTSHHGGSDGPHGIEIESQADRTQEGEAAGQEGEEDGETARRSCARQRQEGEESRQAQSGKEGRAAQEGCPQEGREEGGAKGGSAKDRSAAPGDTDGNTCPDAARAEAGSPAAAQADGVGAAAPPRSTAAAEAASAAHAYAVALDDAWQRACAAEAARDAVPADTAETPKLGRLRLRRLFKLLARGERAAFVRSGGSGCAATASAAPSDKPPPPPAAAVFYWPWRRLSTPDDAPNHLI